MIPQATTLVATVDGRSNVRINVDVSPTLGCLESRDLVTIQVSEGAAVTMNADELIWAINRATGSHHVRFGKN